MKNLIIIVLALLLAAAAISGFIFHGRYHNMKETLKASNEKLSDLNEKVALLNEELEEEVTLKDQTIFELEEKVAQLSEERSRLNDQIRENAELLKELEGPKLRISQLEEEIKVKDQAFSRLDEKIRELEEGTREEKRIGESLRTELSSKDAMVTALQEKLEVEKSKVEELQSTYESLVSDLKRQLEDKDMTIKDFEEKLSITFVDRVLFDFGRSTITPEGRGILRRVGNSLKDVYGMQIRVVGHTDNRPIKREYLYKFPSNWELSSARAAAVARYLQKESGLDPEGFEVVGRSFYEPVASNETMEGRARNRRVEVIIAPKTEE